MRYPNAHDGIKRIYRAEILLLFVVVMSIAAALLAVFNGPRGQVSEGSLAVLGFILIVTGIVGIVAGLMNIFGVSRASKDEPAFKTALYVLLAGICASLLSTVFNSNRTVSSIFTAASRVTEILASYYICTGIINLAEAMNDAEISARARRVRSILIGIWTISIGLEIVTLLFGNNSAMQTVIAVVALAGSLISIVAYFFYLGLLKRTVAMLEQ